MSEEQTRKVELFRAFLRENMLTQKGFAQKIGVSATAINQWMQGKYPGDVASLEKLIFCEIEKATKRSDYRNAKPDYVQTSVAASVKTLIDMTDRFSVDDEGRIGVIIGDSGHGKTKCLRAYAKLDRNALLVVLDNRQTVKGTLVAIAMELMLRGIKIDYTRSTDEMTRALEQKLKHRSMIIMLDEASGLGVPHLDLLRQVITVKCLCPLILAGNQDLLATIMQSHTRRGCESLDQFRSRLLQVLNLDDVAGGQGGGKKLYTDEDIVALYQYGGITLHRSAVDLLRRICQTPGSGRLRTCATIIGALHSSSMVIKAKVIDAAFIRDAIKQLGLPVRLPVIEATPEKTADEVQQVSAAG
jgi:DNA transposition AAA+ family ATPase